MSVGNGKRPLIFEIVWRLPAIDDLLSNVRKPRLYEKVVVTTSQGEYEGDVLGVKDTDNARECKVLISIPSEAHGADLQDVKLVTP